MITAIRRFLAHLLGGVLDEDIDDGPCDQCGLFMWGCEECGLALCNECGDGHRCGLRAT